LIATNVAIEATIQRENNNLETWTKRRTSAASEPNHSAALLLFLILASPLCEESERQPRPATYPVN
jgi:hypothetical protein